MNQESTISAQTFTTLTGALIVDVRTPAEFAQQYVVGSHNIPLGEVGSEHISALVNDDRKPVYLLCGTGMRAKKVADQLGHLLPHNLVVIDGGIQSLDAVGHSISRGAGNVISLERQVRIAAGSLVVLCVLLGSVVHPGFFLLSAIVGAGLCFAGITNTCGMGMLLARMPWNTRGGAA